MTNSQQESRRESQRMSKRTIGRLGPMFALVGLIALFSTACLGPGPWEENFGESVRHNAIVMRSNPDAGQDHVADHEGVDAISGEIVLENYEENATVDKNDDRDIFFFESFN